MIPAILTTWWPSPGLGMARDALRRISAGVIGLVLAGGMSPVCAQERGATPSESRPASTPATTPKTGEVQLARLIFVDRHSLAFDRPGVLQMVMEESETVQAGQVVAQLDDRIAKAALGVATARVMNRAEILSAEKQAELAKLKWDAAKQANDQYDVEKRTSKPARLALPLAIAAEPTPLGSSVYTETYLQELKITYESAEAEISRFEKEYEVNQQGRNQALAELDAMQLKAPRSGLVTRAFKRSGEGAQAGEKVLEIVSTQRIRVEFDLLAATAARLRVGMPVEVLVQQPASDNVMQSERYATVLKFIDPRLVRSPTKCGPGPSWITRKGNFAKD